MLFVLVCRHHSQERPYQDDSTASRLLSEVKHLRAWLVLRWGTTLESQVLFFWVSFWCGLVVAIVSLSLVVFELQLELLSSQISVVAWLDQTQVIGQEFS
jgi:hypothetical protein